METLDCDLVIVGAGAAGLSAALTAQETSARIILLTKGRLFYSGSSFANLNGRWGLSFAESDSEKEQLLTTINRISHGTNVPELSRILVEDSHGAFLRLRDWGVAFNRHQSGHLLRVAPCFCTKPLAAILESIDQFREIMAQRLDRTRVTVLEECAANLLLIGNQTVTGMIARHGNTEIRVSARAAILASGGNAASYSRNIVEPGLTGDGYQLLRQAGIPLTNMEYHQEVWEDVDRTAPRFASAAFFDSTHRFETADGQEIELPAPETELAVARRSHVPISNLQTDRSFDQPLLDHIGTAAPRPIQVFRGQGNLPENRIIPHVMASNGGVVIGPNGETPLTGLYAAGEIACGMHGGDRVGGMMIAAALVFGRRAAKVALALLRSL